MQISRIQNQPNFQATVHLSPEVESTLSRKFGRGAKNMLSDVRDILKNAGGWNISHIIRSANKSDQFILRSANLAKESADLSSNSEIILKEFSLPNIRETASEALGLIQ